MNYLPLCVALLLLCSATAVKGSAPASIDFQNTDLASLQARAAREDKLIFAHFTAQWCMPCQWMENNAFQDTHLIGLLNERFLSVKIDIDAPRSQSVREAYDIVFLPTTLIFDGKGQLLARYETAMEAATLGRRLERLLPEKPAKPVLEAPKHKIRRQTPHHIARPALLPDRSSGGMTGRPKRKEDSSPSNGMAVSYQPALPQPDKAMAAPTSSANRTGEQYGVQVGLYGDYNNVVRQMQSLQHRLDQPVNIFVSHHQGKKVYRLLAGIFPQRAQAAAYARQLRHRDIQGFVKHLQAP